MGGEGVIRTAGRYSSSSDGGGSGGGGGGIDGVLLWWCWCLRLGWYSGGDDIDLL